MKNIWKRFYPELVDLYRPSKYDYQTGDRGKDEHDYRDDLHAYWMTTDDIEKRFLKEIHKEYRVHSKWHKPEQLFAYLHKKFFRHDELKVQDLENCEKHLSEITSFLTEVA